MATSTHPDYYDYTFNPWRGCSKVSPGCDRCVSEIIAARQPENLGTWGPDGTRPVGNDAYWRYPFTWHRQAEAAGKRRRVLCLGMGDWLENRSDLDMPLAMLMRTIEQTPALDWLLLTKLPLNWAARLKAAQAVYPLANPILLNWLAGSPPANVWLGVSCEDQQRVIERVPALMRTPARLRFLVLEPLLTSVNITHFTETARKVSRDIYPLFGQILTGTDPTYADSGFSWVILGGEQGAQPRPTSITWMRSVIQAVDAHNREYRRHPVAVYVRQLGANPIDDTAPKIAGEPFRLRLPTRKGDEWSEWPEEFRVREFPIIGESKGRT